MSDDWLVTKPVTGSQLKNTPFLWSRTSPQPSPVDHVTGGRVDDGFPPPPSPLAKVKGFSSQGEENVNNGLIIVVVVVLVLSLSLQSVHVIDQTCSLSDLPLPCF